MRSTICRSRRLTTLLVALWALPMAREAHGQNKTCTPVPNLYADWKNAVVGTYGTEAELTAAVNRAKPRVDALPNPFRGVADADSATLAKSNERRLWKGDSAFIVVDLGNAPDLMVVPRREMVFLTEASPELQRQLAQLAAAAADAFQMTAGRSCGPQAATTIKVSRPNEIKSKQLHVHVQPDLSLKIGNPERFYADVARRLATSLASVR